MSDEDDFMVDGGDDDVDYDLQYSDDDDADDDPNADLENKYYTAKQDKVDDPEKAIADFTYVYENESPKGEMGFKALKQLCKFTFRRGEYERALGYYKELLGYTKSVVTRNVAEKAINGILEYVSEEERVPAPIMQGFYDATMISLKEAKNDRLSHKTNLKLAQLHLDRDQFPQLSKLLKELHLSIDSAGDANEAKGTSLLEVYALEISMYGKLRNSKKTREIYDKTRLVTSAIPHPRIVGVIKETGGKMHMEEKEWTDAYQSFFDAFKSYDEAGSAQRLACLKYLVMARMLSDSDIDPFESQEAKPYRDHAEVKPMTALVNAYQDRDIHEAERIIRVNRSSIMDDPFIASHISEVLLSLRSQWILELITCYTRVDMAYLARQLGITVEQVESILVTLILDERIDGKIDQVAQRLELNTQKPVAIRRLDALSRWSDQIGHQYQNMLHKLGQAGPHPPQGPGGPQIFGGGFMEPYGM